MNNVRYVHPQKTLGFHFARLSIESIQVFGYLQKMERKLQIVRLHIHILID